MQRLLLIHGRSSYRRISKVILYSFYKNILLYFTQFWFIFFSGFSGQVRVFIFDFLTTQSLYERWTLATYNVIFTLFPVLFYGLLDKDVNEISVIANPKLYMIGINKYHVCYSPKFRWLFSLILALSGAGFSLLSSTPLYVFSQFILIFFRLLSVSQLSLLPMEWQMIMEPFLAWLQLEQLSTLALSSLYHSSLLSSQGKSFLLTVADRADTGPGFSSL